MTINTRDIVTPAVVGLFAFAAVSGVALFFHLAPNLFHSAHEWLGLPFAAFAIWHAARYWRGLVSYAGRKPSVIAFSLALGACLVFVAVDGMSAPKGPSPKAIIETLTKAPLNAAAVALGKTPEDAIAALQTGGISATPDQSIAAIAQQAHRPPMAVLGMLTQ